MWVSRAATGVVAYGWGSDAESLMRESRQAAEAAVLGAPRDPYAHFALAMAQIFSERPLDAVRSARRSIELSPSFALGHLGVGMAWLYSGNAVEAIPPLRHGLGLNPADPQNTHWFRILALAYLFAGDKMQALSFAERAQACRPGWPPTLETLATCHAALGQHEQARALLAEMRSLPALPGAPTDVMFRMHPHWAAEIARLRQGCSS
jgi:Flp pilus assembly protein TadD